jgi:hypothetical protein
MLTLAEFKRNKWSFIVYKNDKIIFRSKASDLKPIITFFKTTKFKKSHVIVFDKIIGRAAALLLSLIKPKEIRTLIISQSGKAVLHRMKIQFIAIKKVRYVMKFGSKKLCLWEKLAKNQTPLQFWNLVKKA